MLDLGKPLFHYVSLMKQTLSLCLLLPHRFLGVLKLLSKPRKFGLHVVVDLPQVLMLAL